ncbi:hypothetical protein [Saccharopolyspora dendranthemae]|uniref:Uncharacterized protein n=1 Tax=Saccharopolyspora dendranthemae TaxID=1181886 RepID=A0A561VBV0_9PSEU|nr:hypothetical protein [Saccharopolyspora dendranthemae]TWG09090.1 hypothetical protein FHU35_111722 [Saccharopolyspora dendranthemae]
MKWLPGGWQRADWGEPTRTIPRGTARYTGGRPAAEPHRPLAAAPGPALLGADARDVDVSAASFRTLLIGGGISGLGTVLIAATLANNGSTPGMWFWQLVFGVAFLWFLMGSRGTLRGRGFLIDRSGFYARTTGEVVGVDWREIKAVGIGTLPWIENKRPVNPERRRALEIYPADAGFVERHPELERWWVEEPPTVQGLPPDRYRFHLPPFSSLPKELESAIKDIAPQKWVGQYRRHLPPPPQG